MTEPRKPKVIPHWIVSQGSNGTTRYERVDFIPNGSDVLADEIEGMTARKAAAVLGEMYDSVQVLPKGGRLHRGLILCSNN